MKKIIAIFALSFAIGACQDEPKLNQQEETAVENQLIETDNRAGTNNTFDQKKVCLFPRKRKVLFVEFSCWRILCLCDLQKSNVIV